MKDIKFLNLNFRADLSKLIKKYGIQEDYNNIDEFILTNYIIDCLTTLKYINIMEKRCTK